MIRELFLPGCGIYVAGALLRCAGAYAGKRWLHRASRLLALAGSLEIAARGVTAGWAFWPFTGFALVLAVAPVLAFDGTVALVTGQSVAQVAERTLRYGRRGRHDS